MTVYANLVIGQDGSTTSGGTSAKLSSQEDRRRFHELRNQVSVILIGGNTARNEPYQSTPTPLVVVSRKNEITTIAENRKAEISNKSPLQALAYAQEKYGENVLIEGGPNFLLELINEVEVLLITISDKTGDGQQVSFDGITRDFVMERMEKVENVIFYKFIREKSGLLQR